MDFESLKIGFISYLEEKLNKTGENTEETLKSSDISIFMYGSEFKDYLVEEAGADVSIFSKSISEIMSMDFVNGKLVDNTDDNSDSFEKEGDDSGFMTDALNYMLSDETVINALDTDKSGDLSKEELNGFLKNLSEENDGNISFDALSEAAAGIQNGTYIVQDENETETTDTENNTEVSENEENDPVQNLLNKAYENKTVIKALDTDGDGKLSDEEKAKFEEFIKGDADKLTEDAIKSAIDDIMDGKFSYDTETTPKENTTETPETQTETEEETAQSSPATSSSGGTSSAGGSSSTSSPVSSNTSTTNNSTKLSDSSTTGMTLEELESEKKTRESDVQKAQEDVNAVFSGDNEAVKSAKEDYESAKEAYDDALKNDDNISDTLKQQRDENLSAIEDKEAEIDDLNIQINDQESLISEQESTIDADKSNISALESALSALPSESEYSDDPDKQAEISSKRSELESAIEDAKQKLQDDEDKLDDLEDELSSLQDSLSTAEDELADLETTRAEIEDEILKNCSPETKQALEAFNEAKDNVTQVKESELKSAKSALTEAQNNLEDINAQINEKKAEETQKEYSVNTSGQELLDELDELGLDLSKLSSELGMTEEETAAYLTELCESEEWGDGCIEPIVLYAQIMQESGFDADIPGDGGAALGLGQFHTCAVDEVNNQYGTNYTYADRSDPKKALEMMVLLLKYDYNSTNGSQNAMLAMYNQGHASAINESAGQTYVKHVLSRIGRSA